MQKIKVKLLHKGIECPGIQSPGAAGSDVKAFVEDKVQKVGAGETVLVPTGMCFEIPRGYEIQVRSRSGLAKKGIFVANSPGTIDSDYRGEVGILIFNSNDYPVFINDGDRVAQLVLKEVEVPWWEIVEELSETERGSGGFGSTGV